MFSRIFFLISFSFLISASTAANVPHFSKEEWDGFQQETQTQQQWLQSPMDEKGEWSNWLFKDDLPRQLISDRNPFWSPEPTENELSPFFNEQSTKVTEYVNSEYYPEPLSPIYEGIDELNIEENEIEKGEASNPSVQKPRGRSIRRQTDKGRASGNQKMRGRSTGLDEESREYMCDVCTRRFERREHLQRHLRTHTNERPFECHICSKRFTRSDNRRQHLKTHED